MSRKLAWMEGPAELLVVEVRVGVHLGTLNALQIDMRRDDLAILELRVARRFVSILVRRRGEAPTRRWRDAVRKRLKRATARIMAAVEARNGAS